MHDLSRCLVDVAPTEVIFSKGRPNASEHRLVPLWTSYRSAGLAT
jgi:hypothetical protein